jgi:hypothetical protein
MIYTGNNGRIYVARSQSSGLQGTFTLNVLAGQSVVLNGTYFARNIAGDGRSATMRADSTVTATASSRSCVFTVIQGGGSDYQAGDVLRLVNSAGVDVTNDFNVTTTSTRGVDNEREILDDQYRIAKIRSWSLTSNSEVVDTTSLGDTNKSFSPSVTSGEGSATLMFYEDDITNAGINRQKDTFELVDLLFPRGVPPRVIMNLAVDGTTSGTVGQVGGAALWKTNFMFNAYITSSSVGVNYGEVVTIDTSFTVDGALIDRPFVTGKAIL